MSWCNIEIYLSQQTITTKKYTFKTEIESHDSHYLPKTKWNYKLNVLLQQSSTKWSNFKFYILKLIFLETMSALCTENSQHKLFQVLYSVPSAKTLQECKYLQFLKWLLWSGRRESSEITVKAADDSNAVWRCFHSCVFGVVASAPRVFPPLVFLTCSGEKTQSAALAKQLIPGQSHVASARRTGCSLFSECLSSDAMIRCVREEDLGILSVHFLKPFLWGHLNSCSHFQHWSQTSKWVGCSSNASYRQIDVFLPLVWKAKSSIKKIKACCWIT